MPTPNPPVTANSRLFVQRHRVERGRNRFTAEIELGPHPAGQPHQGWVGQPGAGMGPGQAIDRGRMHARQVSCGFGGGGMGRECCE